MPQRRSTRPPSTPGGMEATPASVSNHQKAALLCTPTSCAWYSYVFTFRISRYSQTPGNPAPSNPAALLLVSPRPHTLWRRLGLTSWQRRPGGWQGLGRPVPQKSGRIYIWCVFLKKYLIFLIFSVFYRTIVCDGHGGLAHHPS